MSFWVVVPSSISKAPEPGADPVTFYLVEVGVQSPGGEKIRRTVLRRFSDFRVLSAKLKSELPSKRLPDPPPRYRLTSVNGNQTLVEKRRKQLETWLWKLLADVDVAHSSNLTAFLELQAARRCLSRPSASQSLGAIGDTPAGSGHLGTPNNSTPRTGTRGQPGIEDDNSFSEDSSNEDGPGARSEDSASIADSSSAGASSSAALSEQDTGAVLATPPPSGVGKTSAEAYKTGTPGAAGAGIEGTPGSAAAWAAAAVPGPVGVQLGLKMEQRAAVRRLMEDLRRQQNCAKADLEDAISVLRFERTSKELLEAKVSELQGEREAVQAQCAQQVADAVRESEESRTAMAWELEEARTTLARERGGQAGLDEAARRAEARAVAAEEAAAAARAEAEEARAEVKAAADAKAELEARAHREKKVLSKEIRSLRKSLEEAAENNAQAALVSANERARSRAAVLSAALRETSVLRQRLVECAVERLAEEQSQQVAAAGAVDAVAVDSANGGGSGGGSGPTDPLELLSVSDMRVGCLLAEAQLLTRGGDDGAGAAGGAGAGVGLRRSGLGPGEAAAAAAEEEVRRVLAELLTDNAQLRKGVNSLLRNALATGTPSGDVGVGGGAASSGEQHSKGLMPGSRLFSLASSLRLG